MPGIEKVKSNRHCREEDVPPPISTVDPKIVLENVLKQLGKPNNLCPVSPCLTRAVPIKQSAFRVQIYCKGDENVGFGAQLTDTFWVRVNGEGDIMSSIPAISQKYGNN